MKQIGLLLTLGEMESDTRKLLEQNAESKVRRLHADASISGLAPISQTAADVRAFVASSREFLTAAEQHANRPVPKPNHRPRRPPVGDARGGVGGTRGGGGVGRGARVRRTVNIEL